MQPLIIVKYAFGSVGLGMLVGAFLLYRSTGTFLEQAVSAPGTVVDLAESWSDDSVTYRPVVQFLTQSDARIEFASSTSSNPPSYSRGERVTVLYLPDEPRNAKINGFFSLWGGAIILGILGGVFLLVGLGAAFLEKRADDKRKYLEQQGTPITTDFQSVTLDTSVSVNGRHPYRIVTQWRNPSTSRLHVFESENLWFDPSSHLENKKIIVLVDRDNPKRYHVDLGFLPKLAD